MRPAAKLDALCVPPELLSGLAQLIRSTVRAELRAAQGDGDPWVPHPRWPWSRRKSVALARSGALDGVRKVGRDFMVRRSVLDAYIERHNIEEAAEHDEDEFQRAMRRSGLSKGAAPANDTAEPIEAMPARNRRASR